MRGISVELLEDMGFRFSLDWDESVIVSEPESIDPKAVAELLSQQACAETIKCVLKHRALADRRRFIGGPFDGKPHRLWFKPSLSRTDKDGRFTHEPVFAGVRVKRGHWAVYEILPDERAVYRGVASSESKARNCELVSND